jgi:hypothetical protein
MRLNPELIQKEMDEAREWLQANGEPVTDNTDGGRGPDDLRESPERCPECGRAVASRCRSSTGR